MTNYRDRFNNPDHNNGKIIDQELRKKAFSQETGRILTSGSEQIMLSEVESERYVRAILKQRARHIPEIDYKDPSTFAFYGSAEEYYKNSIKNIYDSYPYDGSKAEKMEWSLSASYLDLYVLEHEYPKSTGHIIFSRGADTGGQTLYTTVDTPKYIKFYGGPQKNTIYNASKNRESNLKIDGTPGNTIEFWLKKDNSTWPDSLKREVIVDIESSRYESAHQYGRISVELQNPLDTSWPPFMITYVSGATGTSELGVNRGVRLGSSNVTMATVADGQWHHYAITMKTEGSSTVYKLYVDGVLDFTTSQSYTLGPVDTFLSGTIGASCYGGASNLGEGQLDGAIDEFRYWKTARTEKEIGRFWYQPIHGGTDNDHTNAALGLYYKFNEGVTGIGSSDKVVLDYSGRLNNGEIVNWESDMRSTSSGISLSQNLPETDFTEPPDPIMNRYNTLVTDVESKLKQIGKSYDINNLASLQRTVPSYFMDDDNGNFRDLLQIMSVSFDDIFVKIKNLPKMKDFSYQEFFEEQGQWREQSNNQFLLGCEDINLFEFTGNYTKPWVNHILDHYGLVSKDLFSNASIFETYFNRSEKETFNYDIEEIKRTILSNIHKNLINIFKTKGTEASFRNLIRCFGIDERLIRINAYGQNETYELVKKPTYLTVRQKAVNFRNQNYQGTIYQASVANDEKDYIPGSSQKTPFTLESNIIFPRGSNKDSVTLQEASLFGMHSVYGDSDARKRMSWLENDSGSFQVKTVRRTVDSIDAYFHLTSSTGLGLVLTSSYIPEVYDNTKWNISVRIGTKEDLDFNITTVGQDQEYMVEFTGYSYDLDIIKNQFHLTASITKAAYDAISAQNKAVYVGSHKVNFSGSHLLSSDVKVLNFSVWKDGLLDDELKERAQNPQIHGRKKPQSISNFDSGQNLLAIDSAILRWQFEDQTAANQYGALTIVDYTSGSAKSQTGDPVTGFKYPGFATGLEDAESAITQEFIPSVTYYSIDNAHSSDRVTIKDSELDIFEPDSRPVTYTYMFEKSMYQIASEEMVNFFAGVTGFNNMIGEPVNKYRKKYKLLEKARNRFFNKVGTNLDFDKFIDYYKWIDDSLTYFLSQLVPASAFVTNNIKDVIESHMLERNKYEHKPPTIEFKDPARQIHPILGVNELLYDYEHGRAPIVFEQAVNRKAIQFINNADTIDIPDSDNMSFSDGSGTDLPFSISSWVKVNNVATDSGVIISRRSSTGPAPNYGEWLIQHVNGSVEVILYADPLQNGIGGFSTVNRILFRDVYTKLTSGNWHHLVVTYAGTQDENDLRVYLDGSEMLTAGRTKNNYGGMPKYDITTTIGGTHNPTTNTFEDYIADVVVFDKELNASEVEELYNSGKVMDMTRHSSYSNIISWWKMGDDLDAATSDGIRDYVSTNHGTLVGSAAIVAQQDLNSDTEIVTRQWDDSRPQDQNCLWQKERAEVSSAREIIKRIQTSEVSGSTYVRRALTKPYRLTGVQNTPITTGFNRKANKTLTYASILETGKNIVLNGADIIEQPVCTDIVDPTQKKIYRGKADTLGTNSYLDMDSDLIFPFTLVSSSSGIILDSLKDDLVIANNHIAVGISGEKSLQGSFAETHIGGKPHNKVRINTPQGERPEAYNLTISNQSLTMSQTDINSPKSVFYNNVDGTYFANITNIKHTTGSSVLGNYESEYQVVQTSGRRNNNTHFVDDEGRYVSEIPSVSTYVADLIDFPVPVRRKSAHVMVNKFSSPGGGETMSPWGLDRESGEFSVYNSLNYRNAVARLVQDRYSKEHMAARGVRSGYRLNSMFFPKHNRDTGQATSEDFVVVSEGASSPGKWDFDAFYETGSAPISIAFWYKVAATGSDVPGATPQVSYIATKTPGTTNHYGWIINHRGSRSTAAGTVGYGEGLYFVGTFYDTNGNQTRIDFYDPEKLPYRGWSHFVLTMDPRAPDTNDIDKDRDQVTLYVNGRKATTVIQTGRTGIDMHDSDGDLVIGGDTSVGIPGTSNAGGNISNFMIFKHSVHYGSVPLQYDDVVELYNDGYVYDYSSFSRFSECTGWWKLEKDANDYSTKGNHGVLGSYVESMPEQGLVYRDKEETSSKSYHRVYRNPQRLTSSLDRALSRGFNKLEIFDNQFVQHQIPQHDFSYSWIKASAVDTVYDFLEKNNNMGHQGNFYVSSSLGSGSMSSRTINFLTNPDHTPNLDFVRLNSAISSSLDFDTNTITYLDQNLPAQILNMQGPYGWPTWKQIRGYEHPVSRYESANAKLSIVISTRPVGEPIPFPTLPKKTPDTTEFRTNEKKIEVYDEIMVTGRFNPLTLTLHSENAQDLTLSSIPQSRLESYWINDETALISYSDDTNSEGLTKRETQGPTTRIASIKISHANQETKFSNYKIQNRIYQAKDYRMSRETKNMLKRLSDLAYDDPTIQATEINYIETLYPREINTYTKEARTRELFEFHSWHSDRNRRAVILTGSNIYESRNGNAWDLKWGITYGSTTRPRESTPDQRALSIWYGHGEGFPIINVDINDYKSTNGMLVDAVNHRQFNPGETELYTSNTADYQYLNHQFITASTWPLDCRENFLELPVDIGDSTFGRRTASDRENNLVAQDLGTRGEGVLQNDYSIFSLGPNQLHGTAPPGMLYSRRIPQYSGSYSYLAGEAQWLAGQQSNNYPNSDSYIEHSDNLKQIGQDHSLVPEFICSNHLENILSKNVDFNSVHKEEAFLSVTGAIYHSSSNSLEIGGQFYKTYGSSEFMKYFGVTLEEVENADLGSPYKLTLRCQAVKKFTPYTGFYPAERVVQIGQLFAKGYMQDYNFQATSDDQHIYDVNNYVYLPNKLGALQAKIRANLQQTSKMLFGPGVLLNSIKAGMAVDYPLFRNPEFTVQTHTIGEIVNDMNLANESVQSYRAFGHTVKTVTNEYGDWLFVSEPNWGDTGGYSPNFNGTGRVQVFRRSNDLTTKSRRVYKSDWVHHEYLSGGVHNSILSQSMHLGINMAVDDKHILLGTYRLDRSTTSNADICKTGSVFMYAMPPSTREIPFWNKETTIGGTSGVVNSTFPYKFFEPTLQQHLNYLVESPPYNPLPETDEAVDLPDHSGEHSGDILNQTFFGSYGLAVNKRHIFIGSPGAKGSAGVVYHYQTSDANGFRVTELSLNSHGTHYPQYVLDGRVGEETIEDVARGHFGWAIETQGEWLAVGAPSSNIVGLDSNWFTASMYEQGGRLHIFKESDTGKFDKYQTLTLDSAGTDAGYKSGAMFGSSISLSYPWLAVGAFNESSHHQRGGRVYVFKHSAETDEWEYKQALGHPFPSSVSGTQTHWGALIKIHNNIMVIASLRTNYDGGPHIYKLSEIDDSWQLYNRGELWNDKYRNDRIAGNASPLVVNGTCIGSGAYRIGNTATTNKTYETGWFKYSGLTPGFDINDEEIVVGAARETWGPLSLHYRSGRCYQFKIFSGQDDGLERWFNLNKNTYLEEDISSFPSLRAITGLGYFTGSHVNLTNDTGIPRLSGSVYKRITFDEMMDPNQLVGLAVYDNDPHPSASIYNRHPWTQRVIDYPTKFGELSSLQNERDLGIASFELTRGLESSLKPYRYAINNFCAETVNFFIKDSKLTTIESEPVNPRLAAGSTYKMRVYIKNLGTRMYDRHSAFGPPVDESDVKLENLSTNETTIYKNSHGHSPFVPPYLDPGASPYVEISFTPTETRDYTLEEITEGASYNYVNFKDPIADPGNNTNYSNAMSLSASLDLRALVAYEQTSDLDPGTTLEQRKRWVIQSKWETPILNFINATGSALDWAPGPDADGVIKEVTGSSPWQKRNWDNYYSTRPPSSESLFYLTSSIGMWHQYGSIPTADLEGYNLVIEPLPDLEPELQLAERVGFIKGNSIRQSIGSLSDDKVVSEAVIAVPFLEPLTSNDNDVVQYYEIAQTILTKASKINRKMQSDFIESVRGYGKQSERYKILSKEYDFQYNTPGQSAVEAAAYQLRMEDKFIIPPQFNGVMKYVFQFNAVFNKQDLANIWQNISPTSQLSCKYPRYSKVEAESANVKGVGDVEYISHFLPDGFRPMRENMDIAAGLDDRKVRWLVFKAKQRAKFDLNVVRRDSLPGVERQYNIDSAAGTFMPTKELLEERYSYNWPYDFFSLVELIKLEGKVDMYRGVQIVEEE